MEPRTRRFRVGHLWVTTFLFVSPTSRSGWAVCSFPNLNLDGRPFTDECRSLAVAFDQVNTISSSPYLEVLPTGNGFPTLSSFNVQTHSTSINRREYMVNFGFDATTGLRGNPAQAAQDKVGLYVGVRALGADVGNTWAENPLLVISSNVAAGCP